MKNKHFFTFILTFIAVITAGVIAHGSYAHASTIPTLTLSVNSPGYTQMTVNGDANSSVSLYYYLQAAGSETITSGSLGITNSYGYFSTTLNDANYNIPYGSLVYVNVDGQNSATVAWPNYYSGSGSTPITVGTGGLSLSQTNLTLQVGQTVAITATPNTNYNYSYYQTLTITGNTNPTAVSAVVSGNQVNITGANYGSTTITICQTSTSTCGVVYVTVSSPPTVIGPTTPQYPITYPTYPITGYPIIYSQPISFASNNLSLNAGTSQSIQIYGSGNYYIYRNSNPAVVTASLNGSWLYVQGIQAGTSNITVCENNGTTSCANLPIDIIASYQYQYPYNYSYPWQQPTYNYYQSSYPYSTWNW